MFDEVAKERFWSNVEKRGADQCWPWHGSKLKKDGRGTFCFSGQRWVAPRVALILADRVQPNGKPLACHTCDNPNCVNPAHLWWGDTRDNALDAAEKGRLALQKRTHCPKGHPLSGSNLRIVKKTHRRCHTCTLAYAKLLKRRLRKEQREMRHQSAFAAPPASQQSQEGEHGGASGYATDGQGGR